MALKNYALQLATIGLLEGIVPGSSTSLTFYIKAVTSGGSEIGEVPITLQNKQNWLGIEQTTEVEINIPADTTINRVRIYRGSNPSSPASNLTEFTEISVGPYTYETTGKLFVSGYGVDVGL